MAIKFLFGFILTILASTLIGLVALGVYGFKRATVQIQECQAKGGEILETESGRRCIKREAIIEMKH